MNSGKKTSLIVVLLLMVIAIPIALILVQKNADNRNLAVSTDCDGIGNVKDRQKCRADTIKKQNDYVKSLPTSISNSKVSVPGLYDRETRVYNCPAGYVNCSPGSSDCCLGTWQKWSSPIPFKPVIKNTPKPGTNQSPVNNILPSKILTKTPPKIISKSSPIPSKPTKTLINTQVSIVEDLLKGDKASLISLCGGTDKGQKDNCATQTIESLVSTYLPEYKSKSAEISTTYLINKTANDYLSKTNSQLTNEYCKNMSADRCDEFISNGSMLKAVGVQDSDIAKLVVQKESFRLINAYQYKELVITPTITTSFGNETKKAFDKCSAGMESSTCGEDAVKIANEIVEKAKQEQLAKTILAQDKVVMARCVDLGGTDCKTKQSALDSLAQLANIANLNAKKIEANKLKIEQDNLAYAKIAGTLANQGNLDEIKNQVAQGKTTWTEVDTGLTNLKKDILIGSAIRFNDLTAGRFKRNNDNLNESRNTKYDVNIGNVTLNFTLVAYTPAGKLLGMEKPQDSQKYINSALGQGGDAAMLTTVVVAAAIASPIVGPAAALSAFTTTGVGVAMAAQTVGMAGDVCQMAREGKASMAECDSSRNVAAITAITVPLNLASNAVRVARASQAISGITNATKLATVGFKTAELGVEAFSAKTFTDMAVRTCNTPGVTNLDCASSVAMAVASSVKFVATDFGAITKLGQIDKFASVANAAITGEKVMSGVHFASAGLFMGSACSKLADSRNLDTVSMCAMGMSGAVQSGKGFKEIMKTTVESTALRVNELETAQAQLKIQEQKVAEYRAKNTNAPQKVIEAYEQAKQIVDELIAATNKEEQVPLPTQVLQRPAAVADLPPPKLATLLERISTTVKDLVSGRSGGASQPQTIITNPNNANLPNIEKTVEILETHGKSSLSENFKVTAQQLKDFTEIVTSKARNIVLRAGTGYGKSLVASQLLVVEMAKPGQPVMQIYADNFYRDSAYQESFHDMYKQNKIDRFFYDKDIGYRKAIGYENGKITFETKIYTSQEILSLSKINKINVLVSDSNLRFGEQGGVQEAQGLKELFNQSVRIADEGSRYTHASIAYRSNIGDGIPLTKIEAKSTDLGKNYLEIIILRQKVLNQAGSAIANLREQVVVNIKNGVSNRSLFDSTGTAPKNETLAKIYRETIQNYVKDNPSSSKAQELLALNDSQLREVIAKGTNIEPELKIWLTAIHSELNTLVRVPHIDYVIKNDGSYQVTNKGTTSNQTLSSIMDVMSGNETARQMYDAAQIRANQPVSKPLDLNTVKVYEQSLSSNGLEDFLTATGGRSIFMDATPESINVGLGELTGVHVVGQVSPMFIPREAFGVASAQQAILEINSQSPLTNSEYIALRENTAKLGQQLQQSSGNSLLFDQLVELKTEYSRLSQNEPTNPWISKIQSQISELSGKLPNLDTLKLNDYVGNIANLRLSQNAHENIRILNNETGTLTSEVSTAIDNRFPSRDHHIVNPNADTFTVIVRGSPNREIIFNSIDQYKAYVEKEYYANNAAKSPSDYVLEVQLRDTGLNLKSDPNSHWININDITTTSQSATQGVGRDRFYA